MRALGSTPMTLKAQVRGGRLVLNEPTDLPEGAEVELTPVLDDDLAPEERQALEASLARSAAHLARLDALTATGIDVVSVQQLVDQLAGRRVTVRRQQGEDLQPLPAARDVTNRSRRRRVQRRLERRTISRDELLAPQPEACVLRQAEVERPRNAERPIGMTGPAGRFGQAVELGGHRRSGPRPGAPVVDMRRGGEEVALLRVAARVRNDQVLEAVVRVARPRDEVVHVRRLAGPAREALRAVEAPSLLEPDDRPAHALERHALGAEEEALELVLVEAVQRRDLDRPLVVDQRAAAVVQPDERVAHAWAQEDAVVKRAALAALVAPDVRLPDGLRPVDRV